MTNELQVRSEPLEFCTANDTERIDDCTKGCPELGLCALAEAEATADWFRAKYEYFSNTSLLTKQAMKDFLIELSNPESVESSYLQDLNFESYKVVFVDIDKFKKVNEQYGHDAGDQVIEEIGRRLRNTMRVFDIVAKWGGDEYLVILPASMDDTMIAERIEAITTEPIVVDRRDSKQIKISVSATALINLADSIDDIPKTVRTADDALKEAKNAKKR